MQDHKEITKETRLREALRRAGTKDTTNSTSSTAGVCPKDRTPSKVRDAVGEEHQQRRGMIRLTESGKWDFL